MVESKPVGNHSDSSLKLEGNENKTEQRNSPFDLVMKVTF